MEPMVFPDHEALSRQAANWLVDRLRERPESLFCAASGSTPHRAYELFAAHREREPALFERMRLLKLDEWGGLPLDDPGTCETHLRRALVDPLSLAERYTAFDARAFAAAECARVAGWLRQHGPIDVCLLGLGLNGHLGFNEPAEFLQPHAHVAKLSETSLAHSMLTSGGHPPSHGLTLGMADLLQSRRVLLLVSGEAKRQPLAELLREEITTRFPASFLHLHADVTLFCDEGARA
jgi:galactosamine-6-phosphate isomerase